jgi:hypothetical protein
MCKERNEERDRNEEEGERSINHISCLITLPTYLLPIG